MQERERNVAIKLACILIGILFYANNLQASCGKVITQSNYSKVLTVEGQRYIIKSTIHLGGATLVIPKDATLDFRKKGRIVNGQLIGNNTRIKKPRTNCLGVLCTGTWIIGEIKDSYFDWSLLSDNQILDNISELQADDIDNKILLTKPQYVVVLNKKHKKGLVLKSNANLQINSTITVVGNDLPQYTVISVARDNIKISGGKIVGDVGIHTYVEGTTSQWGFGISISGASNVNISDLHVSRCTGDGIYIGGGTGSFLGDYSEANKNIVLCDIVSDDNRRQGVSITYADGVLIRDCVFSNTGKTEAVSPGCGLDIEPNEGQAVRNVTISNCRFLNNNKILDVSIGGYRSEGDRCNVEGITMENCEVSGPLSVRSGSVTLRNCSMATLSLHLAKMPKGKVVFDHCQIKDGSGVTIRSVGKTTDSDNMPVYTFKSCTIGMNQVLTRAMFSTINHKGNEVAEFNVEDCTILLPTGSQKYDIVQDKANLSFRFSNCGINANGRQVDLRGSRYANCRILTNTK